MGEKRKWALIISLGLLLILIVIMFFYFATFSPKNEVVYSEKVSEGKLVNPVNSLTDEEAEQNFNESFVYYMLYSIKAYNLHNPPLSKNTPKINIDLGEDKYKAEIVNGNIIVNKGEFTDKDIVISSSKGELINMLRNADYTKDSFEQGKSSIELIAPKTTLFGKGYLNLYTEVTGESVTGNVVKIYVD